VLDGATARTDTGCTHGVSWFATRLGSAVSSYASTPTLPLRQALGLAIRHVADQHLDCDLAHPGTPSAAVAILRSGARSLEYLVLGDITILLDTSDGLDVVIDDRVDATARSEREGADRHPIGSLEKQSALVRMKHAELAARNRPGGYWVAAANPAAAAQALIGSVPLSELNQAAVLTDGAARIVTLFKILDWTELLNLLNQAGPSEVVRRVREIEASDPEGRRWPRNKRNDDATVVYAQQVQARAE
jgi:hypothetical protein